jgi:hypothetical protein
MAHRNIATESLVSIHGFNYRDRGGGGSAPMDSGDISVETWREPRLEKKHYSSKGTLRSAIVEHVTRGYFRQRYQDSLRNLRNSTCPSEAA